MADKMTAIVFQEVGTVSVEEIARPSLQEPADALIKVTTSSVCGSDIHLIHAEGLYQEGNGLGHEFVGVIEELGDDVEGFETGDRVAVSCTIQCGQCAYCRKGLLAKCLKGGLFGAGLFLGNLGGAQAEYVRVPFAKFALEKIPEGMSDEQALFVGDILSTGFMAAEKGGIRPGDTVAVFGSGPVGLCAIAASRLFNPAQIIAVDPIEHRREVARSFGATETIDPSTDDPVARIVELTSESPPDAFLPVGGVDVAIEAVGIEPTFSACFQAVKPGGHVSIVGVYRSEQVLPMQQLCIKNITVSMGLVNVVHMARLIGLIEKGVLDVTPLITHTMPLGEGARAYEMFEKKLDNVLKIALKP